jgi:hypothetical protein
MGVFDLHWLRGPGSSVDENFEILALELLMKEFPYGKHRRLRAPDKGIDILGHEPARVEGSTPSESRYESTSFAYQCKAYEKYSADLKRSVQMSLDRAASVRSDRHLGWNRFALVFP